MTVVARRVVVRGRVQGVFFRDSTRSRARELGVSGWVRNAADGSVEAWLEGPAEAVRAAEAFVRSGPPAAQVDEASGADVAPEGLSGFQIR